MAKQKPLPRFQFVLIRLPKGGLSTSLGIAEEFHNPHLNRVPVVRVSYNKWTTVKDNLWRYAEGMLAQGWKKSEPKEILIPITWDQMKAWAKVMAEHSALDLAALVIRRTQKSSYAQFSAAVQQGHNAKAPSHAN